MNEFTGVFKLTERGLRLMAKFEDPESAKHFILTKTEGCYVFMPFFSPKKLEK